MSRVNTLPTSQTGGHFRALGWNVLLKNVAETSRLFQMAFFVVVARRFGPTVLGNLTVMLMVGSVVGLVLGDLGVNTAMIARMSGSDGSERKWVASAGLFWKIILTVLSFVLMIVAMRVALRFGTWDEILAVAVISCGTLWHEFTVALTNGVNRLDAEAWIRPVYRGLVYGGGTVACLFLGLVGVLSCMAVSSVVILAIVFAAVRGRIVPLGLAFNGPLGRFLRESIPVWVTQVSQLTYLKLDLVVLGVLHVAARETGWYAGGWKIVDVLSGIPALLAGAALPLISGALGDTKASAIAPGYLKAMYVLPFFLVLPLSVGAGWVTRFLYGGGFSGTPMVLGLLVWALVPVSVHTFLATLAVAVGRQAEAAKLGASAAALGIVAAFIVVPRFGYQSMAIISLIANSLFAGAMVYRFRDATGSAHWSLGIKSALSAVVIFLACSEMARHVPAVLPALAGPFLYGLALLLVGVVRPVDLKRGWRLAGSLVSGGAKERAATA